MVMAGIDPQSGAFTDPTESIKKEIEDVKASTSLSEKDKKQMLEELGEALKVTQPIQFSGEHRTREEVSARRSTPCCSSASYRQFDQGRGGCRALCLLPVQLLLMLPIALR